MHSALHMSLTMSTQDRAVAGPSRFTHHPNQPQPQPQPEPEWTSPLRPTTFTSVLPIVDEILRKLLRLSESDEAVDAIEAGRVVATDVSGLSQRLCLVSTGGKSAAES